MEVNMTKIMLVEDDKSLREIYGVRLLAEGYKIISAGDGEEALAMAVKEHPDLILSDVMMPKISGFDMLDILRSTPETKEIKVIMMTALSSEDQRARGETLGANRYLVKSQVGIEDVVRTVHDVLTDVPVATTSTIQRFGVPAQSAAVINQPVSVTPRPIAQPTPSIAPQPAQPAPPTQPIAPTPVVPITPIAPVPSPTVPVAAVAPEPVITTAPPEQKSEPQFVRSPEYDPKPVSVPQPIPPPAPALVVKVEVPAPSPIIAPPVVPLPVAPVTPATVTPTQLPQPTAPFSTAAPASLGDRVINPITPVTPAPDMTSLINQELHDGSETTPTATQ